MKKKIILLTGPQGGGKSYSIGRILDLYTNKVCIEDGVGSIEAIDDILFKYEKDDRPLVIATNVNEESLLNITKGLDIQVFHCNYKEGEVPSVYRMFN